MKRIRLRVITVLILGVSTLGGCATAAPPDGGTARETFGQGVKNLLLAPVMIVSGIAQGLAFLPYAAGVGLGQLNRALLEANAAPLDDAYSAAFGMPATDPRVDRESGRIAGEVQRPANMLEATQALQRLLVARGMPQDEARHYIVTSVDTHTASRGHILVGLVYRHSAMAPIRVTGRQTGMRSVLRPEQPAWREPYARDVDGQVIDEVVDWAGVPAKLLQDDKTVAMLLVLAAESIKGGARAPDYWEIERRWVAGDTARILEESRDRVRLQNAQGAGA